MEGRFDPGTEVLLIEGRTDSGNELSPLLAGVALALKKRFVAWVCSWTRASCWNSGSQEHLSAASTGDPAAAFPGQKKDVATVAQDLT